MISVNRSFPLFKALSAQIEEIQSIPLFQVERKMPQRNGKEYKYDFAVRDIEKCAFGSFSIFEDSTVPFSFSDIIKLFCFKRNKFIFYAIFFP